MLKGVELTLGLPNGGLQQPFYTWVQLRYNFTSFHLVTTSEVVIKLQNKKTLIFFGEVNEECNLL
jgi:hypothetical protein